MERFEIEESLKNKSLFVTGATGLIGSQLIKYLLDLHIPGFRVLALVRNRQKADRIFADYLQGQDLFLIEGDVCALPDMEYDIDYLIHGASMTSSKAFVSQPVETTQTAFYGTMNILQLARQKKVLGLVYLSSMEVYGTPGDDHKITELHPTNLDTMSVRNCYPESKRMCENLCCSFASEYMVPTKVLRLTQTFGPGVEYEDGRVFAEFARCAIEKRPIILHTRGETKRNYLFTGDAVSAILTVLLKGKAGEAYNAANEETYCSIYEMAEMVAGQIAGGEIEVQCEVAEDIGSLGYAPTLHMNLDTSKLQRLGWKAEVGLEEMYRLMIASMKR